MTLARNAMLLSLVTAVSCTKPAAEEKAEVANTDEEPVGKVPLEPEELAEFRLSSSISPQLPDAVLGKGAPQDASGKKSAEACLVRQRALLAKSYLDMLAVQLCQLETQSGLKLGGKYKVEFIYGPGGDPGPGGDTLPPDAGGPPPGTQPGGPQGLRLQAAPSMAESMSLFLDDSVADRVTVFICVDDVLNQKIVLNAIAGGLGAKGSFKSKIAGDGFVFQMDGYFDNGVGVASRSRVATQMALQTESAGSSMHSRSNMILDLDPAAVSVIKGANEFSSTSDLSTVGKEMSAAFISPNLGSSLIQRTFDSSAPSIFGTDVSTNSEPQVETSRGFFDSAGYTLAESASSNFAEGGPLRVTPDDLPKLLNEAFAVEFESSDWDCSGTETVEIDTSSDTFIACSETFAGNLPSESCLEDQVFAPGLPVDGAESHVGERSGLEDPTTTASGEFPAPPVIE